jgi:malonate-semialdehyde dehydrogenase (acetylating)/methylmalonate-semialdehyde dehydrogenase
MTETMTPRTGDGTHDDAGVETIEHFIDGASTSGGGDRTGPVYDPARGVVQKRVRFASVDDVDLAVRAAARAFEGWREV